MKSEFPLNWTLQYTHSTLTLAELAVVDREHLTDVHYTAFLPKSPYVDLAGTLQDCSFIRLLDYEVDTY